MGKFDFESMSGDRIKDIFGKVISDMSIDELSAILKKCGLSEEDILSYEGGISVRDMREVLGCGNKKIDSMLASILKCSKCGKKVKG